MARARHRRLASAGAVVFAGAVVLALGGCSCSSQATFDASVAPRDVGAVSLDAPLDDVPPGPQPCAIGIQRHAVTLPPLLNEAVGPSTSRAEVRGDVVLVARVDVAESYMPPHATRGLFARVDAFDGSVVTSGLVDLPFAVDGRPFPRGFRELPDGETQVLFADTNAETTYSIARFAADGSAIEAGPATAVAVNPVMASVATSRGFVLLARGAFPTPVLAEITSAGSTLVPLDVPIPTGDTAGRLALDSADGEVVWVAVGTDAAGTTSGVFVGRFDATASPFALETASFPILAGTSVNGSVWIGAANDGSAVVAVSSRATLVLGWISPDLALLGQWAYSEEHIAPAAAALAGALPDQAIALVSDDVSAGRLFFARASEAGLIAGGTRPLIEGLFADARFTDLGERSDGAYTVSFWSGAGLSLATFCAP